MTSEQSILGLGSPEWWSDPRVLKIARRSAEFRRSPKLAVLDTSWVRTGLDLQLGRRVLPATISMAQSGLICLFMERATLMETCEKIPEFADSLKVETFTLEQMFFNDWLPNIRVVELNDRFRAKDARAAQVSALDPDDYPAAALAALLSPCALFTGNRKHFYPLGVNHPRQGVVLIDAVAEIFIGEQQFQMAVMIPGLPLFGLYKGLEWVVDRLGGVGVVLGGLLIGGAIVGYQCLSQETRDTVKKTASMMGNVLIEAGVEALAAADQGRKSFERLAVPAPESRSLEATIIRELAFSTESMSAQQLKDVLDESLPLSVVSIREFLHENKGTLFGEVRRGSFILGQHYVVG